MEKLSDIELALIESSPDLQQMILEDVLVPHLNKLKGLMKQKDNLDKKIKEIKLRNKLFKEELAKNKIIFRAKKEGKK